MAEYSNDSEVSLCNQSLSLIEHGPIASLDQKHKKAARECRLHYAPTRDALLRKYFWNFAKARAELGASGEAPKFGWQYAYGLPGDCLRVRAVDGLETEGWEVEESRRLVCDLAAPIKITYTKLVTAPGLFDPEFRDLLVHGLAEKLAPGLSRNRGIKRDVKEDRKVIEREAKRTDAQEQQRTFDPGYSDWLDARRR